MNKTIPWNTGSGDIALTYNGQGNGSIIVESDINELGSARQQTISVKTGSITRQVTVTQAACPLNFKSADSKFIKTADNYYMSVAEPSN